jgi:hypothetical protein
MACLSAIIRPVCSTITPLFPFMRHLPLLGICSTAVEHVHLPFRHTCIVPSSNVMQCSVAKHPKCFARCSLAPPRQLMTWAARCTPQVEPIGHAGSLDADATGLVIVTIGQACAATLHLQPDQPGCVSCGCSMRAPPTLSL